MPNSGQVTVFGKPMSFGDVRSAESIGISVIHQESTVFPDLNAVDNVFVGREPRKLRWLLDRKRMRRETRKHLEQLGCDIDLRQPARELSVAKRQMVAMARALSLDCRLLIMDEPTASLSAHEIEVLLDLVRRLRKRGISILYVSHRLEEVFELADRVTVLRDGQHVETSDIADTCERQLIHSMVGRDAAPSKREQLATAKLGEVRLEVHRLSGAGFENISLAIRAGEIVGMAGLVGAGRSEVARAIFGIDPYDAGEVRVDGRPLPSGNVNAAMQYGIGLVPEDRQHEGVILPMSVSENLSLAVLKRISRASFVQRSAESKLVTSLIDKLRVKTASRHIAVAKLSGGNQQKVVLGKWLASEPRVLLLDEPTRGVDVAAKAHVHEFIRELAANGMATLVISSEIPELRVLCDRILVLCEGRIAGELTGTATAGEVLSLALPQDTLLGSN